MKILGSMGAGQKTGWFFKRSIIIIAGALVGVLGCQSSGKRNKTAPMEQGAGGIPERERASQSAEAPGLSPGSLLPLEGAYNVRDLGGYPVKEGERVKQNLLFRAGDLNTLSVADRRYLERLGIRTIVDFRDQEEREAAPDTEISTVRNTYYFPIKVGTMDNRWAEASYAHNERIMTEAYRSFVLDCRDQYRNFFSLLLNQNRLPLLFHCSAGKDRTGFAAALFLAALGLDRETIIQDYLRSTSYVRGKYASLVSRNPALGPLFEARREYLNAAFAVIDREFGGIDSYLIEYLEVDPDILKAIYTE